MSISTTPRVYTFQGPLFKTDEAVAYLGYQGPHALRSLYRFIEKRGVPTARRFHTLLIKKSDLDRAIGLTHARPVELMPVSVPVRSCHVTEKNAEVGGSEQAGR